MPIPDEQQLIEDIAHARGEAKSLKSLYALYGLKGGQRVVLRRTVKRLAANGKLVRLRGGERYGLPRERKTIEGVLQGTTKGFAFLSPDDPDLPDVFIREGLLHGAMHGDRAAIAYLAESDPGRPAGEVVGILERGQSSIVGLFVKGDRRTGEPNRLRPFDQRLQLHVEIPARFSLDAEDGVFVEALLLREARSLKLTDEPLQARVVSILGHPDEPGTDVRVIARSFGLPDEHPADVRREAERAAERTMSPEEVGRRTDLRSLRTVTIDGETARDFDDAISIERRGKLVRLWVHIADVAAHVLEDTVLDADAYERGTSVYFPDRAIHMLPDMLAARACSLQPDQDRLAMTAIMDFDASGEVVHDELCESVIRSDRRLTYTELKRILVDDDPELKRRDAAHLDDYRLMGELAQLLIAAREQRGGLDFDLPVPIVQVDEDGLVTDIVTSERNVAHRIIEEFMIAANQSVARRLDREREPAVYRNHEAPPPEKVDAFREVAKLFGHEMPAGDSVTPGHFQAVLEKAEGTREEYLLTTMALQSMAQARYEVERKGHFGLALTHYTHFTSPIRRYPDLIVHRALKRRLHGEPLAPDDVEDVTAELAEAAEHCSKRERNAEAAERALVEWKKAVFMRDRVGETFDGRVTGITERGIFVLLVDHHVEGYITFQELRRDWYDRDERGFRLVGRDSGRVLRLGDALRVTVTEVDILRRRITMAEA